MTRRMRLLLLPLIAFGFWPNGAGANLGYDIAPSTRAFLLDDPSALLDRPQEEWNDVIRLCSELGWSTREFTLRKARYANDLITGDEAREGERARLAELAIRTGKDDLALVYIRPDSNSDAVSLAAAGLVSLRLGNVEEGARILRRALDLGAPEPDLLRYRLAEALGESESEEYGLPLLQAIIDAKRDRSRSALHLAATRLFRLGRNQEARGLLTARYGSSFDDLTHRDLLYQLAKDSYDTGNREAAIHLWRRLLDRWPDHSRGLAAFRDLRRLEEKGELPADERLRLSGARAARQNGRTDEAVQLLRPYLDRPESDPLHQEALLEMGKTNYDAQRYRTALSYFDPLTESGGTLSRSAWLYRARCYKKMGEWTNAIASYGEYVERFPESSIAPEVQWEISWRLKIIGEYEKAAEAFSLVRKKFPASKYASSAPLQEALCLDLIGRSREALTVLEGLVADKRSTNRDRDDALFWAGDIAERLGDPVRARAAYDELVRDFPETFYGLRAAGRTGKDAIVSRPREGFGSGDPAKDWIASWAGGSTNAAPDCSLLEYFVKLGEWEAARSEASSLIKASEKDAIALLELARTFRRLNLSDYTIRCGRRLQDKAVRADVDDVHPHLLALIYPIGYFDLVLNEAKAREIDPFFILGLMRQESWFQPTAQSSAGACGLMQIMPSTGKHIARQFGESQSFRTENLFDAPTNVRYGAWYIASLQKRYGGNLSIVASAYNAGEGNADIWKSRNERFPQEEYVELINYSETRNYVKRTLSGYWIYRTIYQDLVDKILTAG